MAYSIDDIARALGAQAFGDTGLTVTGAAEPATAGPDDLALAMKPEYAEGLPRGRARAAVVWEGADWQAMGLRAALVVPRPRYALSGITKLLDPGPEIAPGIHPTAVIDPTAEIGAGAAIGPFVVIGRGARIGARARIAAHVSVGVEAAVGDDVLLLEGVRLCHRVRIGHRFIAQPGAVVGSDGFSFVTPEKSSVEKVRESLGDQGEIVAQSWTRIHSIGTVVIGDDVEIGANVAIDRGTIRATEIGSGTKFDNLVHIAHNVIVGRDCVFAGQVGVAGSSRIGDRVILGGQCGVSDNIFVGDDVVAGGATKIFSNAPAGRVLLGSPAMKMDAQVEATKNIRRLPRLFRQVAELQKAVSKTGEND
jgi:UDP-3-O-[3-hydroxymyristoyl] glucosamine N-acyltransferase